MPPSTSLLLGPGPYGAEMVQALLEARALLEVVRYFPHFRLERAVYSANLDGFTGAARPPSLRTAIDLPLHGAAVRLAWAVWRRLPLLGPRETPRGPLFALVDALASRGLDHRRDASPAGPRLLLGWSQVSLRSLRRARDAGARTLLEHPTSHIDAWLRSARDACARAGARHAYSLLPDLLCRRMRAECDAAEHISVLSSYARRTMLEAGVPAAKLLQVPLGVDAVRFSPAPGPPDTADILAAARRPSTLSSAPPAATPAAPAAPRPFRILYVGRLELLKGVHVLLDAFVGLAGDLPGAELWLAGRVLPEIGPFIDQLHRRHPEAARRLRVLGPLPHDALPALYRQADAFAFPSLNDSFGLVLLEAMASGLPVIATPNCAAPDLVDEGHDGHIVPAGDAEALRDRLLALGRDRDRGRALGARARDKVLASYTWAHYRQRLLAACAAALA